MPNYKSLKNNGVYKNHNLWNETSFYDFMIATLLAKETAEIQGPLQFVKFLKDETGIGLKYCKEWYDLLNELLFLSWDFPDPEFVILDEIEEVNSMEDLVYMVDHNLSINQFLRVSKMKQIKKRIQK